MKELKVAVIYCSKYGHTKLLAEAVAQGVLLVDGVDVKIYTASEAQASLAELDSCDGMIFGSPTYMGSIAAELKQFFESAVGRWVSRKWQDKIAGGFTNSSNFFGDKGNTMNSLQIFAMQMGMIWVSLNQLPGANEPESSKTPAGLTFAALNRNGASAGPAATSFNLAAPQAPLEGDLETAKLYGQRVANITLKMFKS